MAKFEKIGFLKTIPEFFDRTIKVFIQVIRGVYISLANPSHLLRSFALIENMYKTFLEYVYFLRILNLVQKLLRLCIKPSESMNKTILKN